MTDTAATTVDPPVAPNLHPGGFVGVGFWPRLGARVIDLIVHYATWFIATIALSLSLALTAPERADRLAHALSKSTWHEYVLGILGAVLYHTIAEGLNGATVGKRLLGLVVVNSEGGACGFGAATIRSLAIYVDGIFFGVVAYSAMEPPYQQRHGDQWARTYVVQRCSALQVKSKVTLVDALALAILADAACFGLMAWLKVW